MFLREFICRKAAGLAYLTFTNFNHSYFDNSWFKGSVIFYREGGAPENWGDQVLFLRSKGGIKRFFQIKKGGSLIFFEEIKYFVKHFRTH